MKGPFHPLVTILRWLAGHLHGFYAAFGLFLVLGLALAVAGIWVFAELAEEVAQGATRQFDERILLWMNGHASPWRDRLTMQITSIGNGAAVITIALVMCAFLWVQRHRLAVILVVVGVAGSDLLNQAFKGSFDRPRPELFVLETPFQRPVSASFPSGHAMSAIVVYILLAYLMGRLGGRGWFKVLVNTLAAILIVAIGASRMYLGVHYPSDVIAGYLLGFAWITFCIFGLEAMEVAQGRSRRQQEQKLPNPPPRESAAAAS
ncbi:MAG TPA: phosphatase PAP2 family protein [Gemmatimonadales bacterium]